MILVLSLSLSLSLRMGIDVNRFIGDTHEPFICAICLDVIDEPINTPCDHLFCKSCFKHGRCSTCREMVQQVKPMNRVLKQIYESLKLKFQATDCDEQLTVTNYKSHDGSCPKLFLVCPKFFLLCPKLFLVCPNCDFKTNLIDGVPKNNHECVQYLKDRLSATEVKRSSTEAKLTETEAKLKTREAKLKTREAKLKTREAKLKTREAKLSETEARLTETEAKLSSTEHQVKELKERIKSFQVRQEEPERGRF